jgi:protein-S-isoprenylcysteine O-methyltransferase Ste14
MNTPQAKSRTRAALARVGSAGLKIVGLFLILEPVWMLLPFAGFLYGSVMQIETLARSPTTAWLTHFVFPVLTLGWLGPVLAGIGLGVLLAAAGQIYLAKVRKLGLVTKGLYRYVRHPQYVALALFGLGILLAWGRAITFIAFFLMMFVYYYLAKSEERSCLRLFGQEYEGYRRRTSFLIPGDRLLRPLRPKLPRLHLPAPVRVAGAFVGTALLCLAILWLIDTVKTAVRTVPYLTATVRFQTPPAPTSGEGIPIASGEVAGVQFVYAGRLVVVRGPYRSAWQTGFAERVLLRLRESEVLRSFLAFLDDPNGDAAIVFCTPYEKPEQPQHPGAGEGDGPADRRGPPADPSGPDRVRLMIMRCSPAPGARIEDVFRDRSLRTIRGACIAPVDLGRPDGQDIVDGQVAKPGPGFPREERWDLLMRQMAEGLAAVPHRARGVAIPGRAGSATLILVQAPILRTRLDPAFAQEILDRLLASAKFRDQLRKAGAGGEVVAIAFPTPGPNWYHEHHGTPQIGAFVILVRPREGACPDELFEPSGRDLLSAFVADMDFGIEAARDCVTGVRIIGPRRDLEERWEFFLSGL